jgi:hypothetical protein
MQQKERLCTLHVEGSDTLTLHIPNSRFLSRHDTQCKRPCTARPPAPTPHTPGPAHTRTHAHTHAHNKERANTQANMTRRTHTGVGMNPLSLQRGDIKGGHVTDWSRFVTLRRARRAVSIICEGSLDSSVSIAAAGTCIEACSAGS